MTPLVLALVKFMDTDLTYGGASAILVIVKGVVYAFVFIL